MNRIKLTTLLNENISVKSYKDLYNLIENHPNSVVISVGSGSKTKTNWPHPEIEEELQWSFKVLFMDRDFAANWLDRNELKEYEKAIQEFINKKLMKDIKWFNSYNEVNKDRHGRLVIQSSISYQDKKELKITFFKMYKRKLSQKLKDDYVAYKKKVSGKDIKL